MKTEHILIIRFSAMGDVAMTVPVVYSLATQYPAIRITVLSRPFARPFFENLAPNVGFMEADIKKEYHGIKGLNALYRRLLAKNFTAIADLHSVLRSSYLRMRFNLDNFNVAHIDKHRKGKHQLTTQNDKKLVQQPTSFENYAEVLAKLGYPVKLNFTSIFGSQRGNLNLLPKTMWSKDNTEVNKDIHSCGNPWLGSLCCTRGKDISIAFDGKSYTRNYPHLSTMQNLSFRRWREGNRSNEPMDRDMARSM